MSTDLNRFGSLTISRSNGVISLHVLMHIFLEDKVGNCAASMTSAVKYRTLTAAQTDFCLLSSLPFFFLSKSQVFSQASKNIYASIAGEMLHLKKDGSSIISGVARIVLKKPFRFWCGGGGDEESAGNDMLLDVFGGDESIERCFLYYFVVVLFFRNGISSSHHEIHWQLLE